LAGGLTALESDHVFWLFWEGCQCSYFIEFEFWFAGPITATLGMLLNTYGHPMPASLRVLGGRAGDFGGVRRYKRLTRLLVWRVAVPFVEMCSRAERA